MEKNRELDASASASEPVGGDEPSGGDLKWMVRVYGIAAGVLILDQLTKWIVSANLEFRTEEINLVDGFFKLVHWGNTGSAFSMFQGQGHILSLIAVAALVGMFFLRRHFEVHRPLGRWAMGVITGGIIGNLIDRLIHSHVIDFIYFYTYRRYTAEDPLHLTEIGFPAFNIADTAICTGIGLMFLLSAMEARRYGDGMRQAAVPVEQSTDSGHDDGHSGPART